MHFSFLTCAWHTSPSFLDSTAAYETLPRILELMAKELGWSRRRCKEEEESARQFLSSMRVSAEL